MSLEIVPVSFKDACAFVTAWHRHNKKPNGWRFGMGVADDGVLVGVCMVSHPVARHLMDGQTLEVIRTATDGTLNANSMLYGAAWRAAKALGYSRLITYTQEQESGSSLKAAGFEVIGIRPPRKGWSSASRPRDDSTYLPSRRLLWAVTA